MKPKLSSRVQYGKGETCDKILQEARPLMRRPRWETTTTGKQQHNTNTLQLNAAAIDPTRAGLRLSASPIASCSPSPWTCSPVAAAPSSPSCLSQPVALAVFARPHTDQPRKSSINRKIMSSVHTITKAIDEGGKAATDL